ncbi:(2Z,6E)-farnesyl diphosphate synthase (plasmid) [Streptomyces sp. YIM 121038]|uniref:polyprenyl diphosphate synthase n=1 Tax=Streptomyces sp. YIM 121038 TaxID=2136401 RepID=UPI0011626783|nr:polyprenyl diphosphate synthase [Streptomyces sp. YIM 121038]QCX82738.1 (2Z,6E)-farnesyl diphosphate synthase [Streptomyces sp. YIM 121038]
MPYERVDIPFPVRRAPGAQQADDAVVAWLEEEGLLLGADQAGYFASMRTGLCAALTYPGARGRHLELAALMIAFGLLVDDQADSATESARDILEDLLDLLIDDAPELTKARTAVGAAWCSLWPTLGAGMSLQWRVRARRDLTRMWQTNLGEQHLLSPADYLEWRRANVGLPVFLDLNERVGHYELPKSARNSAVVRDLEEESFRMFALLNDLFSLESERVRGEVRNMVTVLEATTGCTREQAIGDVRCMVRDAGQRFLYLEQRLPALAATLDAPGAAALSFHVQAMRDLPRGAYEWLRLGTARYSDSGAHSAYDSGYARPGARRVPRHVAFVPDGNRRWARARGVSMAEGLCQGAARFAPVLSWCAEAGVEVVTLWLSSPDNVAKRPPEQVEAALEYTRQAVETLASSARYRLVPIGDLSLLPQPFTKVLEDARIRTAQVGGMVVNLACSYNGTWDILQAAQACAGWDGPTREQFEASLATAGQPPVELVVRTSGERRLSGFMLWQAAEAELQFTDVLWPDFGRVQWELTLTDFAARKQRGGA